MKIVMIVLALLAVGLSSSAFGAGTVLDGLYLTYQPKTIHLLEDCSGHQRDGIVFEYFADGDVKKMFQYENDQLHGTIVQYHPNKNVFYRLQFRKGELDGPAQRYFLNGKLAVDMKYRLGLPEGVARFYREDGKLDKVVLFSQGQVVRVRECDETGQVK